MRSGRLTGAQFATALAAASADPEFTRNLKNQLRASPYANHGVDLAMLLSGEPDGVLVSGIASALRMSVEELRVRIGALPVMELKLSRRADRMRWRGTPGLLVAAWFPGESVPGAAVSTTGERVDRVALTSASDDEALARPLIIVRPAEGFILRAFPQPGAPGNVVQEPSDGEAGGLEVTFLPSGDSVVRQLAPVLEASARLSASDGRKRLPASGPNVEGPLLPNVLYLKGLVGQDPWDGCPLSCEGTLELEFRSKLRRTSNSSVIRSALRTGIRQYGTSGVFLGNSVPLINAIPTPSEYITVEAREDDGWFAQDDYGDVELRMFNETNWKDLPWQWPIHGGGGWRCNVLVPYIGTYACPMPHPVRGYVVTAWKELGYSYQWQPYVSPPIVASVVGPAVLHPTETYSWSVSNLSVVSGPLTYAWSLDGTVVGTAETWTGSINDPASSHNLRVDVIDDNGNWETADLQLSINSGSCAPEVIICEEYLRAAPSPDRAKRRVEPSSRKTDRR